MARFLSQTRKFITITKNKHMHLNTKLVAFVCIIAGFIFQSCNDERSDPEQTARIQVKLIDEEGDYLEVNVRIIDVLYHSSYDENEDEEAGWTSFDSFESPEDVDLTDLTGGVSLILADEVLPAGQLSQIRLVLDDEGNTIVVEGEIEGIGQTFPLETPSSQQSGLKIQINEELEGGYSYNIILDWDVQKSIVNTGSNKYQLKPVIRAALEKNSGIISGFVEGDLADDSVENPVPLENVVVNLFESGADITQDPYTSTTTNEAGNYWLEGLKPGVYIIVINRTGFAPYISADITVTEGVQDDAGTITLTPQS